MINFLIYLNQFGPHMLEALLCFSLLEKRIYPREKLENGILKKNRDNFTYTREILQELNHVENKQMNFLLNNDLLVQENKTQNGCQRHVFEEEIDWAQRAH